MHHSDRLAGLSKNDSPSHLSITVCYCQNWTYSIWHEQLCSSCFLPVNAQKTTANQSTPCWLFLNSPLLQDSSFLSDLAPRNSIPGAVVSTDEELSRTVRRREERERRESSLHSTLNDLAIYICPPFVVLLLSVLSSCNSALMWPFMLVLMSYLFCLYGAPPQQFPTNNI